MSSISLIFPHQLFEDHPALEAERKALLIEETLFFNQFRFHKKKLAFHRASMRWYASHLKDQGYEIDYIDAQDELCDIRKLVPQLGEQGIREIHYADLADDWLRQRLDQSAEDESIELMEHDTPMFFNSRMEIRDYFDQQDSYNQTAFYRQQRKKLGILIDEEQNPVGGKWSFDPENRSKYPADREPPELSFPAENEYYKEARSSVEEHFSDNYGHIDPELRYPITHGDAETWLNQFLENRFQAFGDYQDAMVRDAAFLHHSLLSPMLNSGLLTPKKVVHAALDHAENHEIPLNSLEGFIRQIIGWREFLRGIYELEGQRERTENFWGFERTIPETFWTAETGITPVDTVIRRVLDTGYCHHIERLMVLGNFMLLCEFDPDEVYQWFMELFIDAYDWVMVPNVYGMSQFADGGLMSTKPYISSSNYINKMSNFESGEWEQIWDGLFWRFMHRQRDYFEQNPRMRMLVSTLDRMDDKTIDRHIENAEQYLESI